MNRRDFFKITGIAGAGILLTPNIIFEENYTINQDGVYRMPLPVMFVFYFTKESNNLILYNRAIACTTYRCHNLKKFIEQNKTSKNSIFIYDYKSDYVRASIVDIPSNQLIQVEPLYANKSHL